MLIDTPNLIQWTDPADAAFTILGIAKDTNDTTLNSFGTAIRLLKPLDLSVWLTAQRPALDASGHIIGFASDTGQLELWDGVKWSQVPTIISGALSGVAGAFTDLSASTSFTVPSLASTPNSAGAITRNTGTGRFDFGLGGSIVNHVRLSGDTMTGALTLGTNNTNLQFTDTGGLHPVFVCSATDSFQFKGTNATSGTTIIFSIPQRTDTHSMTINVPLTVLGAITAGKTYVYSGTQSAANATALWGVVNVSGTSTDPNAYSLNLIQTTDTIVGQSGSNRALFNSTYIAGVGSVGAAWAMDVFSKTAGLTGDFAAGGAFIMGAGRFNGTSTFNQGGTSPTAVSGSVWGLNIQANALGTATFMNAIRGMEINMAIGGTASALIKQGLKITNQGSADTTDAFGMSSFVAMGIGASTSSKMRAGIQFAGYSDLLWGWDSGSKLLDASRWSNAYYTVAQNADSGFDAYAVAFTSNFLRTSGSNGPWLVDSNGAMQIGTARFTPSSAGLTIDAVGAYGTGTPTITAGGTGYVVNDLLFYGVGGVAQVTTAAAGVVTGITVLRQPYLASTSTPGNPLATTTDWRSAGTGATLTQAWNTTANLLSLNPSGGATSAGGTLAATAYKVSTNQVVGARITGWGAASNGAKTAFNGSTATLAQTSAAVAQLIADLTTHGLIGA